MREIKFRFIREDGKFAKDIALINGKPYREVNPTDNRFVRVFDDKGYSNDYYNSWSTYRIAEDIIDSNMYTGLKDCNGVEIYEGDIIEIEEDMNVYGSDYGIKKHYSEVYYHEYGFMPFIEMGIYEKFKVLGNKYENKNLLDELQGNEIEENTELLEGV